MSRIGPGPVSVYETIAASRRWQVYALRALFVSLLLAGLVMIWGAKSAEIANALARGRIAELSDLGASFFTLLSTVQVGLVLLAAPAATAGAVCLDRARGSLTHVLVTDLSDAEVVLGKLAARLLPVFYTVAATLPVLALTSLVGGISPESLVILTVVSLALAALGCSLALALSARLKKPHEVLLVVYGAWFVWIVGLLMWYVVVEVIGIMIPPPNWFSKLNPFLLVWSASWWPSWVTVTDVALFAGVCLGLSTCLAAYAVWRLRDRDARRAPRWVAATSRGLSALWRAVPLPRWGGPSLDWNPVLWREWHRDRPTRTVRVVWFLYALGMLLSTALVLAIFVDHGIDQIGEELLILQGVGVWFGLLVVGVTAPSALSEERVRGSLDVLLTTPLSVRSIVLAKWWAAFRVVPKLAILPAVVALFFALCVPETRQKVVMGLPSPSPGAPVAMPNRVTQTVTLNLSAAERVAGTIFPALSIVSWGAAVVSLGLLLATWVKRPGRAITLSVSAYVVGSVLWFFLLEAGFFDKVVRPWIGWPVTTKPMEQWFDMGLLFWSPLGGQMATSVMLLDESVIERWRFWVVSGVGLLATSGSAAAMLGLTLATFERCLGRHVRRKGRKGGVAPKPVPAPHVSVESPRYASSSSPLR